MPKVIAHVWSKMSLSMCHWCKAEKADVDHILWSCPETQLLYTWIQDQMQVALTAKNRILGGSEIDQIIWITNFAIYKAHLMAVDGYTGSLMNVAHELYKMYFHMSDQLELLQDLDE